ncbi:hypothetical protein ILYODFUR_004488 [Ilyodon furcidens]|uniref:Uncharacterized protein n=1 Tax=Ilyodon furcidens TaxID=33524 RepID=A0ABV0TRU8_9TELE
MYKTKINISSYCWEWLSIFHTSDNISRVHDKIQEGGRDGLSSKWNHGHKPNDTDISHRQTQNKWLLNPQTSLLLTNIFPFQSSLIAGGVGGGWGMSGSSCPPLRGMRALSLFHSGPEAFLHRQTLWTKPLSATWGLYGDPQPALSVVVESVFEGQDGQQNSLNCLGWFKFPNKKSV